MAVLDGFSNAPDKIKEIVNVESLVLEDVEDTSWEYNYETKQLEKLGSHYVYGKNIIRMDERKNDDDYANTFRHEYGHFIDDTIGEFSDSNSFQCVYQIEREHLYDNLGGIFKDLQTNEELLKSHYISDILSALSENDFEIESFYREKTGSFWGHDEEYWEKNENADKNETFANLFAIYTENNNAVVSFAERWFPNLTTQFKSKIDETIKVYDTVTI